MQKKVVEIIIILAITLNFASGQVIQNDPRELQNIDVDEHPGEYIPKDLQFISDEGDSVKLGDYLNQGKPVLLILGYYSCPMLCNLVMNGISEAVKKLDWLPGKQFQIVSVSIDPKETDLLASAKKANYIKQIGKPGIENGWTFLTGQESQSKALADAVGFKYYYVKERDEYAHPAVLVVLTEDGKISRYLYGIEYKDFDLKMALLEASEGKVGSTLDRIVLYCYHYDPQAGSYTIFAGNVMRIGGAFTLGLMVIFLGVLWIRERKKRANA
jgi:protein SCO1/2